MHEFYKRTMEKKNPANTQVFDGCQIYICCIFNIHMQFQLALFPVT